MPDSEKDEMMNRLIFPLEALTKHLMAHAAIEESKLDENNDLENSSKVRYEEAVLAKEEMVMGKFVDDAQTERLVGTTTLASRSDCNKDCDVTMATTTTTTSEAATTTERAKTASIESSNFKDIDTIEGFQQFADSLIATD